jgi:hypothetical protein
MLRIYAVRMSKDESDYLPEPDVILTVSKDSKEITIQFKSEIPFTTTSFIMELETYLHEISKAADQVAKAGDRH